MGAASIDPSEGLPSSTRTDAAGSASGKLAPVTVHSTPPAVGARTAPPPPPQSTPPTTGSAYWNDVAADSGSTALSRSATRSATLHPAPDPGGSRRRRAPSLSSAKRPASSRVLTPDGDTRYTACSSGTAPVSGTAAGTP